MAYKFPDFDYIEMTLVLCQKKTIVGRYVTLLTYSIGFPGNIFALCIWLQKRMSNSSGYYLAALALSDLLFLTLQVFHELNDTWEISTLDVKFLCEFYPIIFMTSQYLSPLLVLAFTVERYISICHPFKRERFCTTTRAMIVIVCLAIFCLCMNLIQGYFWSYNSQFAKCLPRPSAIKNGDKSLWSVWTWFSETVVFMLVPLLILFFNVLVINEARRLSKFEKHQLKSHAKSHGNATTVMLIAVSFYHIFTTFPVTIAVALYVQYNNSTYNLVDASALTHQWSSHFRYILVKSIIEEIGLTHYAFNFYIYLITGKIFREEFLSFVRRIICPMAAILVAYIFNHVSTIRPDDVKLKQTPSILMKEEGIKNDCRMLRDIQTRGSFVSDGIIFK
ncbi:Hypothetical predicted protein, partial [Mytilus galloprovincialis]